MKTWQDDDPKASLMKRKRALIVNAAREAFLTGGYADTSMDGIAKEAAVSIKTVYRHFENKDDLFLAVMQSACSAEGNDSPAAPARLAGKESSGRPESCCHRVPATCPCRQSNWRSNRVVLRDAGKFPELGKRYYKEVIEGRNVLMVDYLNRWSPSQGWRIKDPLKGCGCLRWVVAIGMVRIGSAWNGSNRRDGAVAAR